MIPVIAAKARKKRRYRQREVTVSPDREVHILRVG
jgi:hypothetical protein